MTNSHMRVDGDGEDDGYVIDLSTLNLKSLGKITDWDVDHKHFEVTLGGKWTFDIEGSDLSFSSKKGSHMPVVTGGTIDSMSLSGPGDADLSISGLDLSARDLYKALADFNTGKFFDLLLGGNETISGSGFNDNLFSGKGDDTLLGNRGNDHLFGAAGNDILIGGAGDDQLDGGDGADRFVFTPGAGRDNIEHFDVGSDKIDLSAYHFTGGFADFARDHLARPTDPSYHVVIVAGLGTGDFVRLDGVDWQDLKADNFIF